MKYQLTVHLDDSGDSLFNGGGSVNGGFINGHMYIELKATNENTGQVIQDIFSGRHRSDNVNDQSGAAEQETAFTLLKKGQLSQPGNGYIADDSTRYAKTVPGSPTYDPRINRFSHSVEITQSQFNNALARINFLTQNAQNSNTDYTIVGGTGLSGNCVDFVQNIYSNAGQTGAVGSLFSTSELAQAKFAGTYAAVAEKYYVSGDNLLSATTFIVNAASSVKGAWDSTVQTIGDYFENMFQGTMDAQSGSHWITEYFGDIKSFTFGDPHLLSWDKSKYDAMQPGEHVMVKSKTDGFELHTRHALLGDSRTISVNTATAVKLPDGTVVQANLPLPGLTCSTDGDDTLAAPDTATPLIYAGPDNGNAELATPGSAVFTDARYNIPSAVFGVYDKRTMNGTAPFQGFVLAADGNNDKGKSFNVDGSTTSLSDFGYFFVHQAHTNTNINRGLVNGANITFRFVPSPSQYYNEPVWCPYLPGGLLTHGAFNLLRSCASFSDASLNFNGGNLLQDLGNGNFYLDGIYSGQWAKYTLTSQTILTLNGGDVLTAGPNPDTFDYVAGQDGVDTIRQFNPTQDSIRLHGATAADIQLHTVSTDTYIELSNNGVQRGILVEDVTQQQLSPRIAFSPTTDGVPKECASGIIAPTHALQVNGKPLPINPGEVKVVGQGLVYRDTGTQSDKYTVVGAMGDGAEIHLKTKVHGKEHINVKPFLASNRAPGTVSGMLGDNNGNAADDLHLPDGTVLPRPVPSTMLQQHATSWCAENRPHQPLIIPRPGESTMSCDDPKFTGEDPRDEFTTQQLADARQVVLDAGVNATNPFIEELTLDAAAGLPVEDIALDLATLSGNGTDITEVEVIPEDPSCFSELPPPPGGYKRVIAGTPSSDNTTVVFSQNYVYTGKERDTIRIERGSVDNEIRTGCNDGVIDTVTIANDRKSNPEVRRTHDENLPEFGEEDQLRLEGYCPSDLQIVPVGETGSVVKLPGRNLWVGRVAPSQLERQITFTNPDCVGEVSAGTRNEPFLLPLLVPAARVAQDWVGRFTSNENAPEVKIEELPPTATIDPTTVIRTAPRIEEVTEISQEGVLAPYRSFTPGNEKAGAWGIISQNEPPCYYPDGSFNVAYEEGDIPDNALVGPCAYPKPQGNSTGSGQDMTLQCAGVLGSSAVTGALLRAVPDILENLMKRQGFGAWTTWGTAKLAQGLLLYYCTSSLVTTGVTTAIRAAVRGALTYFEFDEETIKFFETGFDGGAKALMCYTNPTLALTSMAGHYVGDACGGYVAEEFRRRCLPSAGEKEVA